MANDQAWRDEAACAGMDTELFLPDPPVGGSSRPALKICKPCPVRAECLDWAYRIGDAVAVLGGMAPRTRAKTRAAYMRTIQEAS